MRGFDDLRFALRTLRKNAALSIISVLALALGIGANSAIFSVVDALLWKPLSFPSMDRIAAIQPVDSRGALTDLDDLAPAELFDLRGQAQSFDAVAGIAWASLNLTGAGEPQRVQGYRVSAAFFDILGVAPRLGRTFHASEEVPGKDQVVVLSYRLWQRQFGSDPGILGRRVQLHGRDYSVAGVMPERFEYPMTAELWVPLALTPSQSADRRSHYLSALAGLKRDVTPGKAAAEVDGIMRRLAAQYPGTNPTFATVLPLREAMNGGYTRSFSLMLLGAVVFVLLIACANVANLQLTHASSRSKEFALRLALGANRRQVIQLLLVQSVVIAVLGAGFGLFLAAWAAELMRVNMPPEVSRFIAGWDSLSIDPRVLAYTLAVAVAAGIVSGIGPALQFSRRDLNETLNEGGRGGSGGRRRIRLQSLLVVAEVSLSMILLIGSGLVIKGFSALARANRPMRPETLLTLRVELPEGRYADAGKRTAFCDSLLSEVRSLGSVDSAAVVSHVPFGQSSSSSEVFLEGEAEAVRGEHRYARMQSVSPEYFDALGLPLLSGRGLESRDRSGAVLSAVVSASFARGYFEGADPIGKVVRIGSRDSRNAWTIVGVVGDVRHTSLEKQPRPVLYRTYWQAPPMQLDVVVRGKLDPAQFASAVAAKVHAVDPNQPVSRLLPFEKVIQHERTGLSYVTALMSAMGLIALVLASVGVYSVMAYSVTERTRELGIRVALGAMRSDVFRIVIGKGMLLAGVGLAIGVVGAFAFSQVLASLVFGVSPTDPAIFCGTFLALALVALLACYFPARRAVRVDPMVALRYE
jgi:putative ABC transport system permease protein